MDRSLSGEPPKAHHGATKAEGDSDQFAIVFAAMGVNMETAHFFKQVRRVQHAEPDTSQAV